MNRPQSELANWKRGAGRERSVLRERPIGAGSQQHRYFKQRGVRSEGSPEAAPSPIPWRDVIRAIYAFSAISPVIG